MGAVTMRKHFTEKKNAEIIKLIFIVVCGYNYYKCYVSSLF